MVLENKYIWSNLASQVEDWLSSHSDEDWGTGERPTHKAVEQNAGAEIDPLIHEQVISNKSKGNWMEKE